MRCHIVNPDGEGDPCYCESDLIQISSLGACSLMTHLGLTLFQSHSDNHLPRDSIRENWMRKCCYLFY